MENNKNSRLRPTTRLPVSFIFRRVPNKPQIPFRSFYTFEEAAEAYGKLDTSKFHLVTWGK